MKTLSYILMLGVSVTLFNCGSSHPSYTSAAQYSEPRPTITASLFDSKDATISEENIQRLLKGKIDMPDTIRVALFKYGSASLNRYYSNWSSDEEYLKTQQVFVDTLVSQIGSSRKVSKVIPVPGLMVGSSPTITQLRETAVRLQADILVVYSVTTDIYYKYKAFQKNEAKAFATCETIVLDTRTGVVPHSSIVTREKQVIKAQEDMDDTETRKRAVRDAVLLTLAESGKRLNTFINSAD